jgi:hypothetical protein
MAKGDIETITRMASGRTESKAVTRPLHGPGDNCALEKRRCRNSVTEPDSDCRRR